MNALVDIVKQRGPISRAELAKRLHTKERRVAEAIAELNERGIPIVFTGKGFIYARRRGEIAMWVRNQTNAAMSIIRKVAGVKKCDIEGVVRGLAL